MTYEEILLYHFHDFFEKHENAINNNQSILEHIIQGECAKTDPFDSEEDEFLDEEEKQAQDEKGDGEDTAKLLMKKEEEKKEWNYKAFLRLFFFHNKSNFMFFLNSNKKERAGFWSEMSFPVSFELNLKIFSMSEKNSILKHQVLKT